jgi:glycine cleavage system regulatory protein
MTQFQLIWLQLQATDTYKLVAQLEKLLPELHANTKHLMTALITINQFTHLAWQTTSDIIN